MRQSRGAFWTFGRMPTKQESRIHYSGGAATPDRDTPQPPAFLTKNIPFCWRVKPRFRKRPTRCRIRGMARPESACSTVTNKPTNHLTIPKQRTPHLYVPSGCLLAAFRKNPPARPRRSTVQSCPQLLAGSPSPEQWSRSWRYTSTAFASDRPLMKFAWHQAAAPVRCGDEGWGRMTSAGIGADSKRRRSRRDLYHAASKTRVQKTSVVL